MYFIPACLAKRTQASGSYFTGLKSLAYALYCDTGILPRSMIHSPMPGICSPLYVPAGTA